ncbi:hypothetical protein AB6A40_010784 [Gnathostoma spinigerum]|uniref:Uncharacterized protein n=1 Tax=Gnathostoma spinigerum TaxID=75299 RepID=A0ABD6F3X1_9BILA
MKRILEDVSVIGENIIRTGSDHRLLRSTICVNAHREERIRRAQRPAGVQEIHAERFEQNLAEQYLEMDKSITLDADYKKLAEALKKATQLSGKRQKKKNRTRISQETIHLMARRPQMKADGVTSIEYVTLCKMLRQNLKEDYDENRKKRLKEAAEKKSSLKTVERDIRLKQHIPVALKNDIRERITNRDRMNDICKNFYKNFQSQCSTKAAAHGI